MDVSLTTVIVIVAAMIVGAVIGAVAMYVWVFLQIHGWFDRLG